MIIDQDEIEALLAQAEDLRDEADAAGVAQAQQSVAPAVAPVVNSASTAGGASEFYRAASKELKRILRVRVPVIVQLAMRPMAVSRIRRFSAGAILEFEKSVEDDLDLYIRNRCVGRGIAVKVGEHFGLRITEIGTKAERIKSMGGA